MKVANKVTQNPSDDEEMSEELNPKLKAIDAKNKARVEAEGRAAAAERQSRNVNLLMLTESIRMK